MKKVNANLIISEPLEKSKTIKGTIEEYEMLGIKKLLFQGEDGFFLLSTRYKESSIDDIWNDGSLVVNISESSGENDNVAKLSFSSIGRVTLID